MGYPFRILKNEMTLPVLLLGGVVGGIYGRFSSQLNPNGNFIGI